MIVRKRRRWLIAFAILAIVLLDKGLYGYADLSGNGQMLRASGLFPFYQPVTYRSAAKRIGIEPAPALIGSISQRGTLAYPREPIEIVPSATPPNVLWLAVESMRFDLLTDTTMPRLWAFAAENLHFKHHLSGGNRTRMGMFTMFYSLHGPYWSHVLEQQRGPVFFDVLGRLGYDIEVFTSAKFSYPEFDRTIFVDVPSERRHEYSEDEVFWHRDAHNVDAIIASLKERDTTKPFMRFLFFESTHAPYQFPESDAIAKPYGDAMNYALMNPERDIELIRNRYVNAAHFVDSQIGRSARLPGVGRAHAEHHRGSHRRSRRGAAGTRSLGTRLGVRRRADPRAAGDAHSGTERARDRHGNESSRHRADAVAGVRRDQSACRLCARRLDVVRSVPERTRVIASEWSGFAYISKDFVATIPLSGGFDADVHRQGDYAPVPALPFFQSHADELAEVMQEMSLFLDQGRRRALTWAAPRRMIQKSGVAPPFLYHFREDLRCPLLAMLKATIPSCRRDSTRGLPRRSASNRRTGCRMPTAAT